MSGSISDSSFYGSMLKAVTDQSDIADASDTASSAYSDYEDDYESALVDFLDEHLDIDAGEAQALVDMAQDNVGSDATVEDVLKEILELLEIDETTEEDDVDSAAADDVVKDLDVEEDDEDGESDSDSPDGTFFDTLLTSISSEHSDADGDTKFKIDEHSDSLASALASHLGIEDDEALSVIKIAHASAKTEADSEEVTIEDVLKSILVLFDIDEDQDVDDVDSDDVEDLDFQGFIVDTFAEIASGTNDNGDPILTVDDKSEVATMLGLGVDDAEELIEFAGGEIGQIIKFLYDDDRDNEISFEELVKDTSTVTENMEASQSVIEEFDSFTFGDYNFEMSDGAIDENNIAYATVDEGKDAMVQYLVDHLGFDEGDAKDLLDELEGADPQLLTFDSNGDGTVGELAFIQFKATIAEYSMKTDDLEDASSSDKKEAFIESAQDAKTAFEEGSDGSGDWGNPSDEEISAMIDQIDAYYNSQMEMFSSMSENVQAAAEMTANLAAGIGDINVGQGADAPTTGPA